MHLKAKLIRTSFSIYTLFLIIIPFFMPISSINNQLNVTSIENINFTKDQKVNNQILTEERQLFVNQNGKQIVAEPNYNYDLSYNKESKFDLTLQKEIKLYESNVGLGTNQVVDIIFMFNEMVTRSEQIKIISDLEFNQFIIEYFNVIPAMHLQVPVKKFLQKLNIIQSIDGIYKLFSNTHTNLNEYFEKEQLSASNLNTDNWWLNTIGANDLDYDGTNVSIAILDTGISLSHIDFSGRIKGAINFVSEDGETNPFDYTDSNGHGTHCAGIAAGSGIASNGLYKGVAPNANLYNLKVANTSGGIESSDVIKAIEWCIENNINIISMSFGSEYPETYNPETAALLNATEHGIITIASAGNSGPQFYTGGSPAAGISVISVGAINQFNNITDFSSIGPTDMNHVLPDVLAPGEDIISTEQYGSLLSNSLRYTNSYIPGLQQYSNYIPLSGTSMACPMVAGAAAILLQAYPYLTPEGVRIALYKGAYPPNGRNDEMEIGNNGIGAGIINVSASLKWLASLSDPYEIIGVFPNRFPVSPFDLLKYPGDQQHLNISVFSSLNDTQDVVITSPEIEGLEIISNTNSLSFSNHSVKFIDVKVKVLENASIGLKSGLIYINKSGSNEIFDVINISVNIEYPKGRIFFDSFHGLNDFFPQWPSGLTQIEIYSAMKYLHENGYKIDYQMQYWSYGYDQWNDGSIITPDVISLADIVVLQTPIIPYSDYEIQCLVEYVNNGGSILILGTRYQAMTVESLNNLLTALGTGMIINKENIFDVVNIGLGLLLNEYNVTNLNTTSGLFEQGDYFEYWYGATATIQDIGKSDCLASIGNKIIIASCNQSEYQKGNIIVCSDYHWLRNDLFNKIENKNMHRKILNNIVEYLNVKNNRGISIQANFNDTKSTDNYVKMDVSFLDIDTQLPISSLVTGDTLNITLITPAGVESSIDLTSLGNGIYSNTSIYLPYSDPKPFTIQINVTSPYGLIQKKYRIFQTSSSQLITINNPIQSSNTISRNPGNNVIIQYTANKPLLNVRFIGSLAPITILNSKNSTDYIFTMGSTLLPNNYLLNFQIIDNVTNSGYLIYYAIANDTSDYFNFKMSRNLFEIENNLPEIDKLNSYIGTTKFNDTQDEQYIYGVPVQGGQDLSITLKVNEVVPYEDSINDMIAIVCYTAAAAAGGIITPIYPNSIPYLSLSYNFDDHSYRGNFNIPTSLEFSGAFGNIDKSQEYIQGKPYYSILWLTIYDSEGGSTDLVFLLIISISPNLSQYIPLIILFVAIGLVIYLLYGRRDRRKDEWEGDYPSDNGGIDYDDQNRSDDFSNIDFKYCIYCGQKIPQTANNCPYCGRNQ